MAEGVRAIICDAAQLFEPAAVTAPYMLQHSGDFRKV
jgi:hypothetical protein